MATKRKKTKKDVRKTIGFSVRKNPFPDTQGDAPYLGEIVDNRTATTEDVMKMVAEGSAGRLSPTDAKYMFDKTMRVAVDLLREGYRVDLGYCTLYPVIAGTFPFKDSPFDPKRNNMQVVAVPSPEMAKDMLALQPVNVTPANSPKPRIDSVCQAPDFTRNRIALSEPFEIHGAALTVRHGDESAVLELPDGGMLEVALTRQTAADGAQRVRARLAETPPAPPPKRARLALNTHGMGGKSAPLATVRSATLCLCK